SCKDLTSTPRGRRGPSPPIVEREKVVDRANVVAWHGDAPAARPLSIIRAGFVPERGDTRPCGYRLDTIIRVIRIGRRNVVGVCLLEQTAGGVVSVGRRSCFRVRLAAQQVLVVIEPR